MYKTILETAQLFNLNDNTIRGWVKSNKITSHKVGNQLIFDINDIKSIKDYILDRYNIHEVSSLINTNNKIKGE